MATKSVVVGGGSGEELVVEEAEKARQMTTTKKKACISNLPSVCVISLLLYLDMLSLAVASSSSKSLHHDGTFVARRVWKHLVTANLASPFITLPTAAGEQADGTVLCAVCGEEAPLKCSKCKAVCYCSRVCQEVHWKEQDHKRACKLLQLKGGRAGKRSIAIATHDIFFASKRQELLVMGGFSHVKRGVREVTKMIIELDGTIRFEASTPMLEARCDADHKGVYHHGEVFSISCYAKASERLDTFTQTRTLITERLPNRLEKAEAVSFGNKLLLIGGRHRIIDKDAPSDIVLELVEHGSEAAQGTWRAQDERLNTPRYGFASIACEGKLFACGGMHTFTGGELRSVEVYDPTVGAWRVEDEEMTTARSFLSLFVFEEEPYAVGGDPCGSTTTTIEKRNKDTKKWERVTEIEGKVDDCTFALVGSKIFAFGDNNHGGATFDYFDLNTKTWASQDDKSKYFSVSRRRMPRSAYNSTNVLITPPVAFKTWTYL